MSLVDIKDLSLTVLSTKLLVSPLENNLSNPSKRSSTNTESSTARHGNSISGLIARRPEIRSPDEANVHDHSNHADGNSLLLLGLTADRATPSEDETIDGVGSDGEDDHADVATGCVESSSGRGESDDCDGLGGGDVPGSLVVLS